MEDWIAQLCCSINKDENGSIILEDKMATIFGHYDNPNVFMESDVFSSIDHLMMSEPPSLSSVMDMDTDTDTYINIDIRDRIPSEQHVQSNTNYAKIMGSNGDNDDDDDKKNTSKESKEEEEASNNKKRPKRNRQPSQVKDHIMVERKRRELLTRQFISLSAIIPNLKKTDKTSVLGDAIKYLKQLKEKVKALEEVVAKQNVESVIVFKKSHQLIVHDDDDGDDDDNNNNNNNNNNNSLPQIEVKMCGNELLFKIFCVKQKGILPKLLSEIEDCNMTIINNTIIPFGPLALDITILAQMEIGFDKNVKAIIRRLESVFLL